MSRRSPVVLLAALVLAAGAALVALAPADEPRTSPTATTAPTASAAPARVISATAAAPPTRAPARAPVAPGRVRLSGRLVAGRLEWAWVAAVSVEEGPAPREGSDVEHDVEVGDDGVPVVSAACKDWVGALVGRPQRQWAVPRGATRVGADGAFVLDLAPGAWVLLAGARGCRTRAESARVERDQEVVWPLERTPASTLAVTCLAAGGQPLGGGLLTLVLEPAEPEPSVAAVGSGPWGEVYAAQGAMTGPPELVAPLDASGTAVVELPAGAYRLERASAGPRRTGACSWDRLLILPAPLDVPLAEGERRTLLLRQEQAQGATVVVTARDLSGDPVPGALVRLVESRDEPASLLLAAGDDVATTGPDGRATFLEVAPGAWFVAARRGTRCGRGGPGRILTDAPHALDVVLDEEEALGDLVVRVLEEPSGAPCEEADLEVEGWDRHPERVGPGSYRLEDVPAGPRTLVVGAPRLAHRLVAVEAAPGASTSVVVRLPAATLVAGRVTNLDAKATVHLRAGGQPLTFAWTDAQGRFRLERGAGAEAPLELEVRASGAFPVRFAVAPPLDDLTLALPTGGVTEVRVLDDAGAPVAGCFVEAQLGPLGLARGTTGPDGRVLFRGEAPPDVSFDVDGVTHHPPASGPFVVRVPRRALRPLPERLETLAGTVLGPDGEPVVGARVSPHNGYLHATRTDERGAFLVTVIAGQVAELTASRADLGQAALRVEVPPSGALERVLLRLPASARLRVYAPPRVTSVSVEPPELAALLRVERGARQRDGAFDLGLLAPGRWRLVARDALLREVDVREVEVALPGPVEVRLP